MNVGGAVALLVPCFRQWRRLVNNLSDDNFLCKRYGAVPAADADPAARAIEAEAFDAAAVTGGGAASFEEGMEALQLCSKEVVRRLHDFVKARSAAAKAKAETPTDEPAAVKDEPSEEIAA